MPMSNHLKGESSPYLLQHAENPVDWYPWGAEALEKARAEDKPIFLSIGYSACHWCHVMEHESFEDEAIASLMNDNFVSIKVDKEERPELDSIYMNFIVVTTGQGGWPMSVFLTPDGKPFYGGAYFPPVRRHNLPAFAEVLQAVSRLWREDREKLISSSENLADQISPRHHTSAEREELTLGMLDQVRETIRQSYDWQNGGWGGAPKFPQPMLIELLLRRSAAGEKASLDLAVHALKAMAQGGMYDLLGGGFARYSVDSAWLVPHFEKMLYDNAQLALVYLHAYQLTGEPALRDICEATLDFVRVEMTHPAGGFYSSLDADADGEEGGYYLWTEQQIMSALPDPVDRELANNAYGITAGGNFNGKNILRRTNTDASLASQLGLPTEQATSKLSHVRQCLLEIRSKRVRSATDDKVLVSWNALMLTAFAEAGRALGRAEYLDAAIRNANFILENLVINSRLRRSWRDGIARHDAYLEDYAGLALALLTLYQADLNPRWYKTAIGLMQEVMAHFMDPWGGFFDTSDEHEALLYRPKDLQDNATPSGNALAIMALLQLATFEGRSDWRDVAESALSANIGMAARYPAAFAQWLCAADYVLGTINEVAIIGDLANPATQSILELIWRSYHPHLVLAASGLPTEGGSPALLKERPMLNGRPTAYVCHGFVCKKPVNEVEELVEQLQDKTRGKI